MKNPLKYLLRPLLRVGIIGLTSILVVSCATDPNDPLRVVDKKYTLAELTVKRLPLMFKCMGINPDTLEPTTVVAKSEIEVERCKTEVDATYPIPPSISGRAVVEYCMKKTDIPDKTVDPDYEGTPEQTEEFIGCMLNIQKYRPVDLD